MSQIKSLKATIEEFEAGTAKFEKQIQKLEKSLKVRLFEDKA